jgi:hypothetical protein
VPPTVLRKLHRPDVPPARRWTRTLPAALDIAPIFVPLAATGLVLVMIGAVIFHARRKENQAILINVVLLALAAVVAWGRFGPYAF